MRAATLFSGIGAPEVARPDFKWLFAAENARFPAAVYAQHFPNTPNLGDITAPDFIEKAKAYGPVDVLIFGSPCQDFSVAGGRAGMDGERGNLTLDALDVVAQLRPRWLAFENVPGLLSNFSGSNEAARRVLQFYGPGGGRIESDEDGDFAAFLRAVQERGYFGAYRVLDAQYSGIPQRRRRLFFVGYLGDWRPPAAVLFEPESLSGNSPPGGGEGQDTAGGVDEGAGDGCFPKTSGTVTPGAHPGSYNGQDAFNDRLVPIAFSSKDFAQDAGDTSPTLRAMPHAGSKQNAGGQVAIAFNLRGRDGGAMPEVDDKAALRSASGGSSRSYVADEWAVRRLTENECARLQGFPDNHARIPWGGKPAHACPLGPQYSAYGNAMPVPVIKWILDRIEKVDALL